MGIAGAAVRAEDLKASQDVKTLEGQKLHITKAAGSVTVQKAKVIQADVAATNGVVHVINGVLTPPTTHPTPQHWDYTRAPGYHPGLHRSRFGLLNNDLPPDQRGPCTFDGPITCPFISTFEELANWNETQAKQPKANPFTPAPNDPETPVLYAINDFNGGYNMDVDVYYRKGFGGWDVVDAFVYFGHTHVTVPPVSWINDCHARNIPILGTVIVEDYAAAQSLADNQESVVVQLARLAEYYGFDGWLINIEADYKPDKAKHLLSRLEAELHKRRGLGASVMMYDSLNSNGGNDYQNALDDQNYGYFNESSTFLTNYWMDAGGDRLQTSVETAGDRASDVVIGIDCFGRGTYYGAGAIDGPIRQVVALKQNLSVGIYSPGWTYQLYPGTDGDPNRPKCGQNDGHSRASCQDWSNSDKRFWNGIKDAWTGVPAPDDQPRGSYENSCSGCTWANDTLTCSCKMGLGGVHTSTLPHYSACLAQGHQLDNADG